MLPFRDIGTFLLNNSLFKHPHLGNCSEDFIRRLNQKIAEEKIKGEKDVIKER